MVNEIEREIYATLSKILDSMNRMNQTLLALMENYRQPNLLMPPPPVGDPLCKACEGAGVMMFIAEDESWKSAYCDCRIND
jgi:hypothetical protein